MKKELIKLANHFDRVGLTKEADYVDALLIKFASNGSRLKKYKVKEGDNLYIIAKKHGLDVYTLIIANQQFDIDKLREQKVPRKSNDNIGGKNRNPNYLFIGEIINIPSHSGTEPAGKVSDGSPPPKGILIQELPDGAKVKLDKLIRTKYGDSLLNFEPLPYYKNEDGNPYLLYRCCCHKYKEDYAGNGYEFDYGDCERWSEGGPIGVWVGEELPLSLYGDLLAIISVDTPNYVTEANIKLKYDIKKFDSSNF